MRFSLAAFSKLKQVEKSGPILLQTQNKSSYFVRESWKMWKTTQSKPSWPEANRKFKTQQSTDANLATLVTVEQCEQILRKFNEIHVTDLQLLRYQISTATEAKGFLGEYYHLCMTTTKQQLVNQQEVGDGEKPSGDVQRLGVALQKLSVEDQEDMDKDMNILKFFIKKLPLVHEEHEKNMIFRKERFLYKSLFAELEEYAPLPWFPKLYLSTHNLLVLQDLDSMGYHSLAYKETLHETEMFPILKGLASMHASSLLYELKTLRSIEAFPYDCLKEITVHPEIPWFTTGLEALMEIAKCHPKYQAEVSKEFIHKDLPYHLKSVFFMVNPSPRHRNVVCHRDTWGGNIFLNPQDPEESAVFVDFQTCRYCPPAIDVIFTLFMNLTKEERVQNQSEYLRYYWDQLQTFVSNEIADEDWGISEAEFMESCEEFQLFGYVYRALAATILKVPKEFVTDDYKNKERSKKLLEYMDENEKFRLLMQECVEDVIEAVVDIAIKSGIY